MQRVRSPRELVDLVQAELARVKPRGRRVVIVGDGGGHGIVASDVASAEGLELPRCPTTSRGDRPHLPDAAPTRNPVDFAGAGEQFLTIFEEVTRLILESGEVDAALVTGYFGGYSEFSDEFRAQETEVALGMARAARGGPGARRPVDVSALALARRAPRGRRARLPRDRGCGLGSRAARGPGGAAPAGVPELPPPVDGPRPDGYWESRELLASAGIELPPARRVADADGGAAAAELGYPVVVKALGLLHKSDVGGVALGIEDEQALEEALARMATLSAEGYSVERMAPVGDGVELIVGCLRDPRFGPVVLVGLGGVYAELLDDTCRGARSRRRGAGRGAHPLAPRRRDPGRSAGQPPLDVQAAAARGRRALAPRGVAARSGRDRDQPLLVPPGSACPRCPRC